MQWTICESDDEWRQVRTATTPPGLTADVGIMRAAGSRWPWFIGPLVALLLLAAGAWVWHAGQRRLAQDETELQASLYLEQWAVSQHDVRAARLTLDLDAIVRPQTYDAEFDRLARTGQAGATPLITTLALVDERGDLAVVKVRISPDVGPAYRQTRFYRRTEEGWLRTAPEPALGANRAPWRKPSSPGTIARLTNELLPQRSRRPSTSPCATMPNSTWL